MAVYDIVKVTSLKTIVVGHADSPPVTIRMKRKSKPEVVLFRVVV